MKEKIALGIYRNPQTANAVLRKLRKAGLSQVASIACSSEGHLSYQTYHIKSDLLERLAKWVMRNEVFIIALIEPSVASLALKLLRHVESGHPLSFLMRPPAFETREQEIEAIIKEPQTGEQIDASAERLGAALSRVDRAKTNGQSFINRLGNSERILAEIRRNVAQAEEVEQTITSSAEWLLDNSYIIQGNIEEVRRNLPKKFYDTLPQVQDQPRVYAIAKEIIQCNGNRLSEENIVAYLSAFQRAVPLTIGELWALPLMLRFRLIENIQTLAIDIDRRLCEEEKASFFGNRLLFTSRREPENLQKFLTALTQDQPHPSPYFAEKLIDHLYDEEAALPTVKEWLEKTVSAPIDKIIQLGQRQQTLEEQAFSNGIVSLMTLAQLSWREIFEAVSQVDAILTADPTKTYAEMDFNTRDQYRHSIEKIAKLSNCPETEIAKTAVQMAEEAKCHVGYYLIDQGRPELEEKVGCKPTFYQILRRKIQSYPALAYLGTIALLFIAFMLGQAATFLFILLAFLPISEVCIQLVNLLFTQILPPYVLPKMSYEKGIPESLKTLVVYPVMLSSKEQIEEQIHSLEITYLANHDPQLLFGLVFDFLDAPEQQMPRDQELLNTAVKGFEALNEKYGVDKFFLFYRERVWSAGENCWMGWERKRGKLECLNRFLLNESNSGILLRMGMREKLNSVRYVITLDADTLLPKDTAQQLIETISHPLNHYAIIQPRVSTQFTYGRRSLFARIFSDVSSADPYTQNVSDVYQDLTHEGTYHGKGIYDLKAFHKVLSNRFPEERVLSHDLLEGSLSRTAFANDISLLDQFPNDYASWVLRHHRWMRGDWQNSGWLFDSSLSLLNRWKILDNLRRALLPVGMVALLIGFGAVGWVAAVLLIPVFAAFPNTLKQLGTGVLRALIQASLLFHQAFLSLDALGRVLYRRFISHRHLLEWSTAPSASTHRRCLFTLGLLSIIALAIIPFVPKVTVPFCILWAFSPLVIWGLNRSYISAERLADEDRLFLRQLARRTWRYFDEFVGAVTNWLPPDNYQSALLVEVAPRTSPTNIGLWTLSALAAYDLKYITADLLIERISATMQTLSKLETFEGHLLNWYDIQTLKPLYPRYVSTVDSGNLLASLWTLEQGLMEMVNAPLLPYSLVEGLQDTMALIKSEKRDPKYLQELLSFKIDHPTDLTSLIALVRNALDFVRNFITRHHPDPTLIPYWVAKLQSELEGWESIINRYFIWIDSSVKELSLQKLATEPLADSEAFHTAQWLAGEKLGQVKEILSQIQAIDKTMNMQFLYNRKRQLFSIGYHIEEAKLDSSHYDLLASEARISSVVAIARGDVPIDHWWALGRPYRSLDGRNCLISWGGSMFEYLMPLLFNPFYRESLLGDGCLAAVERQIAYGKQRGIPWGISEAAYSEIDSRKTYQYRSFGVPGLGFKRGLEEDLVISPYSSALALAVKPNEAIENLRRLTLNLLSDFGYYESIDFARQHGPHGERGVVIYAFMAHHEGMSMLSFDNILNRNPISRRFHMDPRIAGVESLLYERIPQKPSIAKGSRKEVPLSRLSPFPQIPIMGIIDTPQSATPKVNLLSNGTYSIMLTNAGGGYTSWKEIDITRWRSDSTCDCWGSYCYIKEMETGTVWSTTFQPTLNRGHKYSVSFKSDKVEFRRRDDDFDTVTEIVISPEDDAEVRLMTLANLSKQAKSLELTSFMELALAPHATDRAHPCFNKLFIETEYLPEIGGLLAFRRLRSSDEAPLFAVHVATEQPLQYETDRALFIGRGGGIRNPIALEKELSNTAGTVLDPIFSLRYRLPVKPRQHIQIAFITAVAETREKAIALMKKYRDISSCYRALEMAWTQSQLELRHLRIQQEEAQLFQKLASRVLYAHAQLRPSSNRLCLNRCGQSKLWAYGISGDLPIVSMTITDPHEIDLVKQLLNAHAFWRMRGLKVDLVILNEEATSYEHPLFEQIQRLIYSHVGHPEMGKSGGVYLLNSEQIPLEDQLLILSVSRVALVAARGSLRQQVISPIEPSNYPARLVVDKKIPEEPSKQLPFLELAYFNGIGGYTKDGREYVIYLGPNAETPAPWINVIANEQFGTLVSEAGLGCTWYGNSQTNRLTPWSNDPLLNPVSDVIYLRDEEIGVYWTATPSPIRELDPYRIAHGQGYSRFEHNSHGIEQTLDIFVSQNDPLRLQRLKLRNGSSRRRLITLTAYSEIVLGGDREVTEMHVITEWDPESQALFAYNRYNSQFGAHLAFATSYPLPSSFTGNRTEFIGRNSHLSHPAALKRKSLSGFTGAATDPCAALQVQLTLDPGEEKEVTFVLGYAENAQVARQLILKARQNVDQMYREVLSWWDKILNTIQIETATPSINFLCNRWLLYQTLSCRYWGRTAFYQSGGAFGFRDQLQDVLALLYSAPHIAREHILRAATHQFEEGDVQHWWHPDTGAGVRTRISDDLLWLPFVTAHYVRVTGDASILQEQMPFLKAELLTETQEEAFFVPETSKESASLLEHCRRAIYRGLTEGPHGLPLIGSGDWNDGMNRVGTNGKGESVWLAWFIIHVLNDFAELMTLSGQSGDGYLAQAKRLADAIEKSAWDGNWYLRAFMDDGTPLGSHVNEEDRIDSLPQSWAVISGAADEVRQTQALKSVEEYLEHKNEKMVLLLTPPFDKMPLDPGYIKGYPPGVRENGGQYTHGSLWVPMAFARRGDGEKAVQLLEMMQPISHTNLELYRVEPYVLAADIYALPGQVGRGGWTWYTGSSGWMYRIWLEEVLGFTLRGDRLILKPRLPATWDKVKLVYRYQETRYEISMEKGAPQLSLDGSPVEYVLLVNDGKTHTVHVPI